MDQGNNLLHDVDKFQIIMPSLDNKRGITQSSMSCNYYLPFHTNHTILPQFPWEKYIFLHLKML